MKIQKFEDLILWQKAQELACIVYTLTKRNNDFGFKDQIRRAAVSISNNLAEGFDRASNRDFARFIIIAKGSANEVRSMAYLGADLKYFTQEESKALLSLSTEILKMAWKLINHLRSSSN